MKCLELMTYSGKKVKTDIDVEKLSEIDFIEIEVVSGDEIAYVRYIDGRNVNIDSIDLADNFRIMNFYGGSYYLYDSKNNINHLDEFEKRKSSYDMEKFMWEDL